MTLRQHQANVAIIDSGAGGLSVAREIIHRQLDIKLQYIADKAHYPYGTLDDKTLIQRLEYLVEKIHITNKPDIIILACNTASTLALDHLRSLWETPFIGVVPAVKPAAKKSHCKKIAVLATNATVERAYLSRLIAEHAADTIVTCHGSQRLVDLAEHYLIAKKLDQDILNQELQKLISKSGTIDQVVLACTHFPIIKEFIERQLNPKGISVVDSTDAIVNRLCALLPNVTEQKREVHNYHAVFASTGSESLTPYSRFIFGEHSTTISPSVKFVTEF